MVSAACRANNSVMLRDLLLAGLGVTLTPEFVVRDLVQQGRLVEMLADHRPDPLTVWGVVANPRYVAHKVRVFLEFVQQQMNARVTGDR